jgi:hypothetical protein
MVVVAVVAVAVVTVVSTSPRVTGDDAAEPRPAGAVGPIDAVGAQPRRQQEREAAGG